MEGYLFYIIIVFLVVAAGFIYDNYLYPKNFKGYMAEVKNWFRNAAVTGNNLEKALSNEVYWKQCYEKKESAYDSVRLYIRNHLNKI